MLALLTYEREVQEPKRGCRIKNCSNITYHYVPLASRQLTALHTIKNREMPGSHAPKTWQTEMGNEKGKGKGKKEGKGAMSNVGIASHFTTLPTFWAIHL